MGKNGNVAVSETVGARKKNEQVVCTRVHIYDRRCDRPQRIMDLIVINGQPTEIEIRGSGSRSIDWKDAMEQINGALKRYAAPA